MPCFAVLLTRAVTESTSVTVHASNAEAAVSAAFAALSANSAARPPSQTPRVET